MSLASTPAAQRTAAQDHSTLLVSWWCTLCALAIILTRVIGRYVRTEQLFLEDKITAWSIIPLLARMAFVHVVLLYGTNNTVLDGLTAQDIEQRAIGSRLVLPARIFYAMFIWVCKLTVSEFLKRLTTSSWNKHDELILKGIRVFLGITFIGVVVGTLSECQPFDDYWQVVPDPGPYCRNGFAQLFTMGICDIITDVVLIIFPLPVIFRSSMPLRRKITTMLLYSLSVFLIAIASYRIPAIVNAHGSQQLRSLWASIEILAATACSNAVIIGSFIRDRGVKKSKFKRDAPRALDSTTDAPSFNRTITRQHWGNDSDEDLFRSCRGRMNSLASDGSMPKKSATLEPLPTIHSPRAAPMHDVEAGMDVDSNSPYEDASLNLQDAGGLLGPPAKPLPTYRSTPHHSIDPSSSAPSSQRDSVSIAEMLEARHTSYFGAASRHRERRSSLVAPDERPSRADELELNDPGGLLK